MGTKSSTGAQGGYPRASRAMPSRYPGGRNGGWCDADAPIIAGHYISNLQQPNTADAAYPGRGEQRGAFNLAAYATSLQARLRCAWIAVKRLFSGSGHHLAASGSCFSPLKRSGRSQR